MTEENNYSVDIVKGFRRLGNFPPFVGESFETKEEAEAYARGGKDHTTTAYISQRVAVVPNSFTGSVEDSALYLINSAYELMPVGSSGVNSNEKLTIPFTYQSFSGVDNTSIILPAGYVMDNITITFFEAFANEDAISIGYYKSNEDRVNGIVTFLVSKDEMLSNEEDSEFTFKITKTFKTKTRIYIFINNVDNPSTGSGIIKIN